MLRRRRGSDDVVHATADCHHDQHHADDKHHDGHNDYQY